MFKKFFNTLLALTVGSSRWIQVTSSISVILLSMGGWSYFQSKHVPKEFTQASTREDSVSNNSLNSPDSSHSITSQNNITRSIASVAQSVKNFLQQRSQGTSTPSDYSPQDQYRPATPQSFSGSSGTSNSYTPASGAGGGYTPPSSYPQNQNRGPSETSNSQTSPASAQAASAAAAGSGGGYYGASTGSATSASTTATNASASTLTGVAPTTSIVRVTVGIPILSYSASTGTNGVVGVAMSITPSTLKDQGAAITGCAIKASTTALPAWATLDNITCVIAGTPTGSLSATTYTIDATNSAGTSVDATVSLSVSAGAPILSYAGAAGTSGVVGTGMSVTPTTLNNQGGVITNCAIKASTTALPAWASLNTSTCVITGTPTSTQSATTYTIDATNAAGVSADATVSLTVTAGVPVLSYAGSSGTNGTVGSAMSVTPTTLNTRGAAITGCAIKASTTALPAWATLNTTTCVITGTPTSAQSSATYTIDATNSAGTSSDATVSLTVGAGVPILSYAGATGTAGTVGTAMSVSPTTLNNQGGAITNCAIKASTTALPAWATLNTTTCVITGTPTSAQSATTYTIDATNAAGVSADATVSLTVNAGIPILSYAGAAGTSGVVGTAMSVTPSTLNTQGAAITGCAIKASTTALPAWATLNTTTCVITGTPNATQNATTYTIDATNAAGVSADATVSLTVNAGIPILSYAGAAGTIGSVGTAMSVSPTTLNNEGSVLLSCAVKTMTTPLPAWATLNSTTCVITGTPTSTQSATTYTIDATNSAGTSADATVSLSVGAGVPILSYASSAGTTGAVGTAMSVTPSTLNNQGSAITDCEIKVPTTVLPAWATLNPTTCVITGTPTATQGATTYTIDATNSAGVSTDATVSLTVNAGIPILSYAGAAGTSGSVGTAMSVTPTTLNTQGAAITGCAIKASTTALPAWATLNTTTCVITGTPTSAQSSTTYTIDATNSAGTSSDATVSLTVGAGVPILSYAGATGTAGTVGTAMSVSPTTLNNQGGAITNCAIKASTTALPAWATLNTTTCVITGTPTNALSATSYTIDATNSAGTSSDATVSLSAVYPVPTVTGISPGSGTYNGGTAVTITGTGFYSGAAVTLGTTACTSITIVTTTQITCTTPAEPLGAVAVNVANTGTTAGSYSSYTFIDTSFTQNWDFGTASQYTYDSSKIQFGSGVASLIPASQTDSSNVALGFQGGSNTGTAWDTTNNYVRLDQSGTPINNAQLSADWTPEWSSLASYWTMDNTWADSTGNNPGIPGGAVTFTSSAKIGTAAGVYDGSTAYMTSTNAITNPTVFTISAWFNTTTTQGGKIMGFGNNPTGGSSNYDRHIYMDNSGAIYFGVFTGGATVIQTVNSYNDGVWHYVVATIGPAGMALYIDGTQVGTNSNTTSQYFTGYWKVGYDSLGGWPGTVNSYSFQGLIDDVAVWNTALTSTEVDTIYSRQSAKYSGTFTSRVMDGLNSTTWTTLTPTTTLPFFKELPDSSSETSSNYSAQSGNLMNGIIGLWHLDEPSGSTSVNDTSGNSMTGTVTGDATLGNPGMLGTSAHFDGNSPTGIDLGNSAAINSIADSSRSVSFWFKIDGSFPTTYGTIISKNGSTDSALYILVTGNQLYNWSNLTATPILNNNQWYHGVYVYDRMSTDYGTQTFYIDGQPAGSNTGSIQAWDSATDLAIGKTAGNDHRFNGDIDEVAIWNRALSPSEVTELYRRGANRIKYQVRSCGDSTCSANPMWQGPDNTNQTYFSELNNNAIQNDGGDLTTSDSVGAGGLITTFANFSSLNVASNRYFQYRAIMESDDAGGNGCSYGGSGTWCSPELQVVAAGPNHYDTTPAIIVNNSAVSFATLSSLTETLGSGGCSQGTLYNLSPDGSTWYYLNSGVWTAAGGTVATASTASTLSPALSTFPAGSGQLYFKVFLQSSGTSACVIDNLKVTGNH